MTENATVHTVEHLDPSELPETNWLWRRTFIFVTTLAALGLAYWIVGKTADIDTLRMIARLALYLVAFFALLYIAGAGSEDITRLVTAFRSTRKETVTSAPPPAAISAEGDVVTGEPDPAQFGGPRP